MATPNTLTAPTRGSKRLLQNAAQRGLPDPRPITDYAVTLSTISGHSRLTVVLSQPCAIKNPLWPVIDCTDGSLVSPTGCTIVNNTTFHLDYPGVFGASVAFVQVPSQDTQVQNSQGGFVRSGGQWFRKPS